MKIALFAKRCTSHDGNKFIVYTAKMKKKDGTKQYVTVKFTKDCEELPPASKCPCYIEFNRNAANMAIRKGETTNEQTGEIHQFENYTLWLKSYTMSPDKFVDHSMDDFAD